MKNGEGLGAIFNQELRVIQILDSKPESRNCSTCQRLHLTPIWQEASN